MFRDETEMRRGAVRRSARRVFVNEAIASQQTTLFYPSLDPLKKLVASNNEKKNRHSGTVLPTFGFGTHLVPVRKTSASEGSEFASHGEHTSWLSHGAHNVNVISSRKKTLQFLMRMAIVLKKHSFFQRSKKQNGHKKLILVSGKSALRMPRGLIA